MAIAQLLYIDLDILFTRCLRVREDMLESLPYIVRSDWPHPLRCISAFFTLRSCLNSGLVMACTARTVSTLVFAVAEI
jgi:hypothetical protein